MGFNSAFKRLSSYTGKKEKLNRELYYVHLKTAHEWGKSWNMTVDSVHESINNEIEKKYHLNGSITMCL